MKWYQMLRKSAPVVRESQTTGLTALPLRCNARTFPQWAQKYSGKEAREHYQRYLQSDAWTTKRKGRKDSHTMTYPRVNKILGNSYTNEEVEEIIRFLADPSADYWGLEASKLKTLRNQIDQLLHRQAYSNDYYLTASTLGIAQTVGLIHVYLGGLEETNNKLMKLTQKALDYLATGGEANQISKDSWIITQYPLRIYGEGKNWVYLYYFLRVEGRILKETEYTAEKVIIELLFRTDKDEYLERAIHTILKRHDKHIPPEQMNGEKEWFLTNSDKVKSIYESILNPFDK